MGIIWHEQETPSQALTVWTSLRVLGEAALLMVTLALLFVGAALVQP